MGTLEVFVELDELAPNTRLKWTGSSFPTHENIVGPQSSQSDRCSVLRGGDRVTGWRGGRRRRSKVQRSEQLLAVYPDPRAPVVPPQKVFGPSWHPPQTPSQKVLGALG